MQKKTFEIARLKKVNILTSVKDNQKNLKEELLTSFDYFKTNNKKSFFQHQVKEKGQWIEKTYSTLPINSNTLSLEENKDWLSLLKTAILVKRQNLKTQEFYLQIYVTNRFVTAIKAQQLISKHWNIENNLHKHLDMALKEDFDKSSFKPINKSYLKTLAFNVFQHNSLQNFSNFVFSNSLNLQNMFKIKGLF